MAGKRIGVSVSAGERARITAAADALGMSVAGWVRRQALSATADPLPLPAPLPAPPARRSSAKRTCSTWLTEEQLSVLVEHARACQLTVSTFIREVLFDGKLNTRRSFLRSAIVAVHRAGNDLNHMFQLANGETLHAPDTLSAIAALRHEIHSLRDALLTADSAAVREPFE